MLESAKWHRFWPVIEVCGSQTEGSPEQVRSTRSVDVNLARPFKAGGKANEVFNSRSDA